MECDDMDITLITNGLDLHEKLSTYKMTLEVTYRKIVTTLDDVEHPYPGKTRPIITFSLLPLTDDESKELYDALKALVFQASFTNQYSGIDETKRVRLATNMESAFALTSIDGKRRYKGTEVQLRGL